jgi:hypothetical protein
MATTKNIYGTAKEPVVVVADGGKIVGIQAPNITANVSYKQPIGTITYKSVVANILIDSNTIGIDNTNSLVISDPSIELNITLNGLGEEAIPESGLFTFKSNIISLVSLLELELSKPSTDLFDVSELFNLEPEKVFVSFVNATDDVLGESSIDDDQYVEVFKENISPVDANELVSIDSESNPTELFGIVETNQIEPESVSNDISEALESIVLDSETLNEDPADVSEIVTLDFESIDFDLADTSSLISNEPDSNTADITDSTDNLVIDVEPVVLDTTNTFEDLVFDLESVDDELINTPDIVEFQWDSDLQFAILSDILETFDIVYDKSETDLTNASETLEVESQPQFSIISDTFETVSLDVEIIEEDLAASQEIIDFEWIAELDVIDISNATDDVLGEASLDDDQYVEFFKDTTSIADLLEEITFELAAELSFDDLTAILEIFSVDFESTATDSSNVLHVISFEPDKNTIDVVNNTDTINIDAESVEDDIALILESGTVHQQDYFADPTYAEDGYIGTIYII